MTIDIERLRRVALNGWVAGADVLDLIDAYEAAQLDSIEARNPGIDMDEVKRLRVRGSKPDGPKSTLELE